MLQLRILQSLCWAYGISHTKTLLCDRQAKVSLVLYRRGRKESVVQGKNHHYISHISILKYKLSLDMLLLSILSTQEKVNPALAINIWTLLHPLEPELNLWCNLQHPAFRLQDLFLLCKFFGGGKIKGKPLTGPHKNGDIGQFISCIFREQNPLSCHAAYVLFSAKGLITYKTLPHVCRKLYKIYQTYVYASLMYQYVPAYYTHFTFILKNTSCVATFK